MSVTQNNKIDTNKRTVKVNSEVPGFFKKTVSERLEILSSQISLTEEDKKTLQNTGSLDIGTADHMLENVIGTFALPVGIATNFTINGRDYFIPMALEEPSVVAAASFAAKLARSSGGFQARGCPIPQMIAQVQLVGRQDWTKAIEDITSQKASIIRLANMFCPTLVARGGGATDLELRVVETQRGPHLVVHILADVGDAMGANFVTRMAEGVSSKLEDLSGGRACLRILSNLAIHRVFRAEAVWSRQSLATSARDSEMKVDQVIENILDAWALADADPFRASTHNKGILNGVDAVAMATGNDWRAVEAAAHSYAAFGRPYGSLTRYEKTEDGHLRGIIEIPLTVATAGGVTQVHPVARINNKILGARSAEELGCVIAAVGLAQNFAALRALATEGIVKGHMKLHAKNVAIAGGAKGKIVDVIASIMALEGNISTARAKELVIEMCHVM
eukprot:TRINITY_DN1046_c0_g1_i1.p1 TRINITY_DN1046_c0_g1~~TRINITY_DN1046_c0_g1_i1.p1  ORF type:complete len:449 (-),score=97.76 TRINITY_DN1046_c0_g1_i1:115-1461(-)